MLLLLAALWGASYLFIKVAVEDIPPAPMMAVRTLLAAAVLLGYLAWRLGWTRAVADLRAAWRHCARARRAQRGAPVLADRLGRAAHRLRPRRRGAGLGADLQRADPAPGDPARAAERRPGARARDRDRRRRGRHRDPPERRLVGDRRRARDRRLLALLRERRRLRAAGGLRHGGPDPRHGLDARRRLDPAPLRRSSSCPRARPASRRPPPCSR